MALNDLYGVRTQFRDHGRVWTVNMYYRDTTGVSELEATSDLSIAHNTTIGPLFDACRATDSTREGTYSWSVTKDFAMPNKVSDASTPGSSGSPTSTPPNMCAVLTLRTEAPEAVRFGRIYLAGLPGAWVEAGMWNAAADTALGTLATALQTPLAGAIGTWQPVILRRISGGVPIVPPAYSDVSVVTKTRIIYSQRRRNSRQIGTAV